ncbi:MAG: hypothetical protein CHACPFDD_01051 [Phycisphaerae bacterium]|nr:hypothetical protein [Phycisphaerae bacterium]
MTDAYRRETIENWVSDFCASDAIRAFGGGVREYAQDVLVQFMVAACDSRGAAPGDIDEPDVRAALLNRVAKLDLPASIQRELPGLCGEFLSQLEDAGRLGGGRVLGAYARALRSGFEEAASGKAKPIERPGSRIGRNDPCPCGSGKKYKKCCMRE